MRPPDFWSRGGALAHALAPLGRVHAALGRWRQATARPWTASVPVICVGNLVAGGAGKTPVAISLGGLLIARGLAPHFLTRGYGGRMRGPVLVDPDKDDARAVGDEALLLCRTAPTWITVDRVAGARAATAAGADALVLDDGFQNPGLAKTLSILVFDGGFGIGNGRVLPAGPLRETVGDGLSRADAAVVIEPDEAGVAAMLQSHPSLAGPVLRARLRVSDADAEALHGKPVFAFAGIGRPEKFFRTLEDAGARVLGRRSFADHHVYRPGEVMAVVEDAARLGALPVTTEKDAVRLPAEARTMVETLPVAVEWFDPVALDRLLAKALPAG